MTPPTVPEMRVHELKCLPDYFAAIRSGVKTHETRKDDRGFKIGDILRLREFSTTRWLTQGQDGYSGDWEERRVTYISYPSLHTPIPEGYVVMSLADDRDEERQPVAGKWGVKVTTEGVLWLAHDKFWLGIFPQQKMEVARRQVDALNRADARLEGK